MYQQSMLSRNNKKIKNILLKIFNFYNLGKICLLHDVISLTFLSLFPPHSVKSKISVLFVYNVIANYMYI